LAALLAARLAISLKVHSFILECDYLTVTLALQHPNIIQDWHIAQTISHVLATIPSTTTWTTNHVN
jgi:hypothetical protein